ncbi:MAG: hypothetical protein Q9170_000606 [Blastenia crenularia]
MATSLARQLAQIRAHSTNALDLKAQKKAHTKSLLFDASHAATQDFNSLFQICYEGWQELCGLDERFSSFSVNLFSEQSKQEDRTEMTATQNSDLDRVLEDFMGLVGGRLLLKPALKAVEWLVRRFSVLAILPEHRPVAFKFLQPYIQSSTSPPRHAIVHTAAHNQELFSLLNTHTMRVCRRGQQYPALLSFWSSTASEALSIMLDQSRFSRLELQKQNQEDLLRRIMPILAEGLAMPYAPDLRIGCYMIVIILGSKSNLSEELLATLMDMVVQRWDDVNHAGLICLAVLSRQNQTFKLPKKTFEALIALENLTDDLVLLKSNYQVEKVVLCLILGSLKRLGKAGDANRIRFVRVLLEADLMQLSFVAAALAPMLRLSEGTSPHGRPEDGFNTQSALADLILCLSESQAVGSVIRVALENMDYGKEQSGFKTLQSVNVSENELKPPKADIEMHDADDSSTTTHFETLVSRIPAQTAFEMSLLTNSHSYVFGSLLDAFEAASRSQKHMDEFLKLSVLRRSLALTEPFYVSFFIRIWCGHYPISVRVSAITTTTNLFGTEALTGDVQVLVPYILYALADPSPLVRRAAAKLVLILASSYSNVPAPSGNGFKLPVLGKGQIYGQGRESQEVVWLPWQAVVRLIQDWLVPHLEEFRLDADQLGRSIINGLNSSAERVEVQHESQGYSKSLRSLILACLCSHVVNTPIYAFKERLLPILTRVSKTGQVASVTLLTPMLAATISQGQEHLGRCCEKEHVDASQYVDRVMEIAKPSDNESINLLQSFVSKSNMTDDPLLLVAAFHRLHHVWTSLRPEVQVALGGSILGVAMSGNTSPEISVKQREAIGTLRAVTLSTDTLQSFIHDCPNLSETGFKTDVNRQRTASPSRTSGDNIRKIGFVLELVESSAAANNFPLLSSLFKVLADLQTYKQLSGIELHYLELLTMNSLRGILERSANLQIERNNIRVDVLVGFIRHSSDPQVQQTALLLVSVLAGIAPELILHDVMPIFTFMGSDIMKRTDDYSAYVVKQTMDSVIPRMMISLRKRHRDTMVGVSELLLSFAAAFEHIPRERRLTLFQSLMEMVGVDEFLFALLVLLHNKLPDNKRVLQFSIDLLNCYEVETQLLVGPIILHTEMSINRLSQDLLAVVLGGLPMGDFVSTLQNILDHADNETCFDALGVFELRLRDGKPTSAAGYEACLGFLPQLTSILEVSKDAPNRRLALMCINHIAERFGKKNVDSLIQATKTVVGAQCLGTTSEEVHVSSLLCLSTIVDILQDEFIPFVPRTLPRTLSNLNKKLEEGNCSKRLHNANFSFVGALLLHCPWVAAGPDLDQLLKVSHGSANAGLDGECVFERRSTLELIAKRIEPKECCASLERTWANAMAEGPQALKEQLLILQNLLGRLSKSAIGRQSEDFARLFLKAFDLRRIQFVPRTEDSYADDEVEEVEAAANAAAIILVTKINDTIFRPIFTRLVEWAASSSDEAKVPRQITIFNFCVQFFDHFKSIVTNYAGLILDDATEILKRPISVADGSRLLWVKVVQTLQHCFKHDQDGFWQSPTHFGPVSQVLLDQLGHAPEAPMAGEVITSITELAVAADSSTHHKTLNTAILSYTRSDSNAIRLSAVQCQRSLTTRLGEEWLALLPEMLPFISELQEDDDEIIEQETLSWIKNIEDILGESLIPMLQ